MAPIGIAKQMVLGHKPFGCFHCVPTALEQHIRIDHLHLLLHHEYLVTTQTSFAFVLKNLEPNLGMGIWGRIVTDEETMQKTTWFAAAGKNGSQFGLQACRDTHPTGEGTERLLEIHLGGTWDCGLGQNPNYEIRGQRRPDSHGSELIIMP
jgi:hypothetical protein